MLQCLYLSVYIFVDISCNMEKSRLFVYSASRILKTWINKSGQRRNKTTGETLAVFNFQWASRSLFIFFFFSFFAIDLFFRFPLYRVVPHPPYIWHFSIGLPVLVVRLQATTGENMWLIREAILYMYGPSIIQSILALFE